MIDIKNKEEVIKWLNEIKKGSGDATLLWKAVTPKIIEFVEYGLDPEQDSHKLWPRLSLNYLIWKIRTHHVSGMGFLSGTMRKAAGEDAIKEYTPTSLIWKLNSSVVQAHSKNGYDYSMVFNYGGRKKKQKPRPIYRYTQLRINSFLAFDVKQFNDGRSHNSFTYRWLKKSLEKGYK